MIRALPGRSQSQLSEVLGLGDGLKLQVFSDTSGHRDAQPPPTPPPGVAQPPLPGVPQPPPETKPFQGKET